jgi:2-polyprenyl-3-methyl-5-hydroxy-6-metoxy-1,4-benzoquinol methylase
MTKTETSTLCKIGDIPFWRGAQATPDVEVHSFAFERDEAGMIRQRQSVAAKSAVASYASDDYYFQTSPPGSSEWGNHLAKLSLDGIAQTCGDIAGLSVLEIGGGTLYNARHYINEMGASSVTLVDPAVQEQPAENKITVRREYFTEEVDLEEKFQLIISLNVLEHIPDPESFLRAIHKNLSDEGRVFLKMPECEDSLRQGDLGLCVHEHITYFTPESLDALMARAGLERIAQANYQGALQVVARKVDPRPEVVCQSTVSLLEEFNQNFRTNLENLSTFSASNSGGKVAFVGASAGLANVLNLSDICKKMTVEVFDSDTLKTGRFLPGVASPIRHISDDKLEEFDTIFVSPVNFFDEIASSLRQRPALRRVSILRVFMEVN